MESSLRLWVFRLATAIVVPAFMVITAEASLRLVDYGHPSTFTVPCIDHGRNAFCDNDRFTWQFFPAGAFRLPLSIAFPAEKAKGSFRIFVLGESAAQGDPEPAYSFARYLEVMLRDRFPGIHFEVINTGITAVNSHVLLPMARDLARHQGDLFVLYLGNNEVVGPFGPGTTLTSRSFSLPLIRAGIFLRSTWLGQLLENGLRWRKKDSSTWRGMEMFLQQRVPANATAMARVYDNFQSNLHDIIEVARRSGARVLVSTIGVNLKDSAPFASLHRADLKPDERDAWEAHVREGAALEKSGRQAEALQQYLLAAAIDDRYAELQFRIGSIYWALADFAAARERFALARDLDALRFRADSQINDIIRSVVGGEGPRVELVDAEKLFADASAPGLPGQELFYDHVHMNPRGNYLLARELFPHVTALLPENVPRSGSTVQAPSEDEAERLLALTPFDRSRVAQIAVSWLTQPPFISQLNHDENVRALQRQADSGSIDPDAIVAAYRWAIDQAPEDRWLHFNYGAFLEQGDPAAAAAEFRAALELLPGDYWARQKLADSLVRMGKFQEGIDQCREILREKPYDVQVYLTMAYALARLRSFDESISAYEQAVKFFPEFGPAVHNNIGLIQLQQRKFDLAAASFQKALELDKHDAPNADIVHNLKYALEQMGMHAEMRGEPAPQ